MDLGTLRQLFHTNLLAQVSGAKLRNPSTLQGSKHPGAIAPRRFAFKKSVRTKHANTRNTRGSKHVGALVPESITLQNHWN